MLKDHIYRNYHEEAEEAIRKADDAIAQSFIFDQRWDMERTYETVVFDGDIDFLSQPGGDPEWTYAFNRLRHFISLGEAYVLTGDERYADCLASQAERWIDTVRPSDKAAAPAWRTIESGIRLDTFVRSYLLMGDSAPFRRIEDRFMASVEEHASFILANAWNSYHLMSNWGVLANHGLYVAACVFGRDDWQREALRRLSAELENEVYDDGTQWEQSPMYHNEVMRDYLDVLFFSDRYGYQIEPWFREKVRRMAHVAMAWVKPDGSEPMMGDSDDIDMRDLLTYAAYVLKDGTIKAVAYDTLDFETSFFAGDEGIEAYGKLEARLPDAADFLLPDSGNGFARTGWGREDSYLRFHCGTLGAGHGHADQTHVSFVDRGRDFLVDAGRYTYVFDGGRRDFKDNRAHNVVIVDGRECYPEKDSWECLSLDRAVNLRFASKGEAVAFEGGHLGYLPSGVFANRRVVWLKRHELLVIIDELYATGHHGYEGLFHFAEGIEPVVGGNGARMDHIALTCLSTASLSLSVLPSQISRHYNQKADNKALSVKMEADGPVTLWSVFDLSGEGGKAELVPVRSSFKGITFSPEDIEAMSFTSPSRDILLVCAHKEYATPTDTFSAGGCTGFGNLTYFDRKAGCTEIGVRLFC